MANSSPRRALAQVTLVMAVVTTFHAPSLALLVAWGAVLFALGLSHSKGDRA